MIDTGNLGRLNPFDPGYDAAKAALDSLEPAAPSHEQATHERTPVGIVARSARVPQNYQENTSSLDDLDDELPYGAFLEPRTRAYERAIFIGNLLYKLKTPAAVVLPRNVDEVAQIVKWAQKSLIPITVKNGGHSYAGYCLNHGGVVIDLSAMKEGLSINSEGTEVTIPAGCIWKEVYDKLVRKNLANIIIGGQCPTVGVSGFTLGGGCSPFSRSYGLGSDNVLEMKIVTPDGVIRTLNDKSTGDEADLWWALRGGGGGNFGVLVQFKARVHQLRDDHGLVSCGELTWNLPERLTEFKAMMNAFDAIECPDELTVDAFIRSGENGLVGQMTVLYNGGMEDCKKAMAPLLQYKPNKNDVKAMQWNNWVILEGGFGLSSKVFHHHASWIFGQGAITPEFTEKVVALLQESQTFIEAEPGQPKPKINSHFLWDHIGGATSKYAPDATPFYWRNGVYAANFKMQWEDPTLSDRMILFIDHCKEVLNPYALDGKAGYLNYIDPTVEDWQQAYYGANYHRLQQVKIKFDPNSLFRFPQGIVPLERGASEPQAAVPIGTVDSRSGKPTLGWGVPPPEQADSGPEAEPSATERTQKRWKKFAFRNVSTLPDMRTANVEELYDAIAEERARSLESEVKSL